MTQNALTFLPAAKTIVLVVALLGVAVCSDAKDQTVTPAPSPNGYCGWAIEGRCAKDTDCVTSGCSGQVCQPASQEPMATTCEWRDCYDAKKHRVTCGCTTQGVCGWKEKK